MSEIIYRGGPLNGQVRASSEHDIMGFSAIPSGGRYYEYRDAMEFDDDGRAIWALVGELGPNLPGLLASKSFIAQNASYAIIGSDALVGPIATVYSGDGVALAGWQIAAFEAPRTWEQARDIALQVLADRAGVVPVGEWLANDSGDSFRISVEPLAPID